MNCSGPCRIRREHSSIPSKTRRIHGTHLTTAGDRLWSNMRYLRPLATITEDTIAYGFDEDGAGVHDVIGSRVRSVRALPHDGRQLQLLLPFELKRGRPWRTTAGSR
mmetsp:Transcript_39741/g.73263  ORF Transcript_39741/g.73263 Transcript_39741/m.73263 type:complete len:107 (+) Transcript_39741:325-645(+)